MAPWSRAGATASPAEPLGGGKAAGQQADRGAFDIALAAR
jgi:hypothetical protein